MARSTQPVLVISIVLEGYNQSRRGAAGDTLHALARQDYPLGLIEIILVGSSEQVAAWRTEVANTFGFKDIKFVACDKAHYYQMKNAGAKHATGEIVAFTDSDVRPRPGWARAIDTASEKPRTTQRLSPHDDIGSSFHTFHGPTEHEAVNDIRDTDRMVVVIAGAN